MSKIQLCLVFITYATLAQAANLPNFFNKCKKDDPNLGQCIFNSVKSGYKSFTEGDQSVHLQSLNPLKVPFVHIDVDGGLIIDFKDCIISGFETAEFKSFTFDLENKQINMSFHIPEKINLLAEYDMKGRILILPIEGKGLCNITYVSPIFYYKIDFDINEKSGKQYIVPKKNEAKYEIKRAYFQLDNLFNGQEPLASTTATFLNENWKEVNEEIGVRVGEAVGEVLTQLLGSFFKKVPLNDFFEN